MGAETALPAKQIQNTAHNVKRRKFLILFTFHYGQNLKNYFSTYNSIFGLFFQILFSVKPLQSQGKTMQNVVLYIFPVRQGGSGGNKPFFSMGTEDSFPVSGRKRPILRKCVRENVSGGFYLRDLKKEISQSRRTTISLSQKTRFFLPASSL